MPEIPAPRSPADEAKEWFSPAQLAEWLDIPLATIYDWRKRKRGPHGTRLEGHVRYRRAHIEAWIAAQEVATTAAAIQEIPRQRAPKRRRS
jgi:predicted DNA-binding transcriptional regulator AlpA